MKKRHNLDSLKERLLKIDIDIEYSASIPWVYLNKINGVRVTEVYQANHGFCIGLLPLKEDRDFKFNDISEIFKLIRKYEKRRYKRV